MNNFLRDGESQSDTLCISACWALKEAKKFEQLLLILLRNTNACVFYTDPYKVLTTRTWNSNYSIFICKFKCIWKEIKYHLENSLVICVNHCCLFWAEVSDDFNFLPIRFVLLNGDDFPNNWVNIEPLLLLPKLAVLHLSKVKEILCQAQHDFGRGVLKPKAFVKLNLKTLQLSHIIGELTVPLPRVILHVLNDTFEGLMVVSCSGVLLDNGIQWVPELVGHRRIDHSKELVIFLKVGEHDQVRLVNHLNQHVLLWVQLEVINLYLHILVLLVILFLAILQSVRLRVLDYQVQLDSFEDHKVKVILLDFLNLLEREPHFLLNQQIDFDLLRNLCVFILEIRLNPVRLFVICLLVNQIGSTVNDILIFWGFIWDCLANELVKLENL